VIAEGVALGIDISGRLGIPMRHLHGGIVTVLFSGGEMNAFFLYTFYNTICLV